MKLRGRIVRGFCDLLHVLVARIALVQNGDREASDVRNANKTPGGPVARSVS